MMSPMAVPDTQRRRIPLGLRYMLLAAFFFSLMSLFVKWTGKALPSQEIVLIRSAVTLVYSYLLVRYYRLHLWGERIGWLLLRGLAGFGALAAVIGVVLARR